MFLYYKVIVCLLCYIDLVTEMLGLHDTNATQVLLDSRCFNDLPR